MQNKLIHESRTCTPHSKKRSNPHSKIKNCPCFLSKIAFFQFCLGDYVSCLMLLQSYGRKKEYYGILQRKKGKLHGNEKLEPLSRSTGKASGTFLGKQSMERIMIKSQQELQRLSAESVKCNMIISSYTCISDKQSSRLLAGISSRHQQLYCGTVNERYKCT